MGFRKFQGIQEPSEGFQATSKTSVVFMTGSKALQDFSGVSGGFKEDFWGPRGFHESFRGVTKESQGVSVLGLRRLQWSLSDVYRNLRRFSDGFQGVSTRFKRFHEVLWGFNRV